MNGEIIGLLLAYLMGFVSGAMIVVVLHMRNKNIE